MLTPILDDVLTLDHESAAECLATMVVENITRTLGYRPWYVGNLKLSRTLERMSALLIGISQKYALTSPLGWNVQGVQPD